MNPGAAHPAGRPPRPELARKWQWVDAGRNLKPVHRKFRLVKEAFPRSLGRSFMKADIHPKYVDSEIRCACGNVIKTRSTKPTILVGICNVCHPFYTGQQKFVDTAGRVDKFQQRLAKTKLAQDAAAASKKKK
jgi:large subunit ribosomal protein L31